MKTWEQKWKNDAPPMDEETEDALLKLLQGEDDDPSSSLSSGAQKKHCDPTDDSATIDGGVQGGEARQMKGVSQSQVSPVTTSERRKWDGNAEGVPAAKRTKTEAENGESDSDSEFVYEHKMMRLRRAAELRGRSAEPCNNQKVSRELDGSSVRRVRLWRSTEGGTKARGCNARGARATWLSLSVNVCLRVCVCSEGAAWGARGCAVQPRGCTREA